MRLDPDPEKRVALTVPVTSRGTVGVKVPMPMLLPVIYTLEPDVVNWLRVPTMPDEGIPVS